jgi:hypothetical protein
VRSTSATASPPKKAVRGTPPPATTAYCSRSPPRNPNPRRLTESGAPSVPPPLNGAAIVPAPQGSSPPRRTSERSAAPPLSPGVGFSPATAGSPWGLGFGPAAAAEEEEEEELATVGGEPEHRALRDIFRDCISTVDVSDLPAPHNPNPKP